MVLKSCLAHNTVLAVPDAAAHSSTHEVTAQHDAFPWQGDGSCRILLKRRPRASGFSAFLTDLPSKCPRGVPSSFAAGNPLEAIADKTQVALGAAAVEPAHPGPPLPRAWSPSGPILVKPEQPHRAPQQESAHYDGELQIVEDFRTPSMTFSDLTDSWRWTCWKNGPKTREPSSLDSPDGSGPGKSAGAAPKMPKVPWEAKPQHPQLEFSHPHQKVHVHLEDKAAEYPTGRVLWDADYDMGGTEVLKGRAKPMGGNMQEFHPLCPPRKGPAHWYELTVTRKVADSQERSPNHDVEDFIGSQVVTTYRPDQDPDMRLFGNNAPVQEGGGGGMCSVM